MTLIVIWSRGMQGMEERDVEMGSPNYVPNELHSLVSSAAYYPQMQIQNQMIQERQVLPPQLYVQPSPPVVVRVEYVAIPQRDNFYSLGLACFAMGILWGINIGMSHCS